MPLVSSGNQFVEDIIDGMYDWVRVIDRDDNIIYINKSMSEMFSDSPIGKKCYSSLGRNTPCDNCISRKAVFDGRSHQKDEVIGDRIFSVMSSPVKNTKGEIAAVVEVLRDITQMKTLQKKVMDQNERLEADLNVARKLQCSLLPKGLPEEKLSFSFIYQPCEALGGDFLDIFIIDEDHVGIYIADVSGHGVAASMLTVFLRSSINKKLLCPSDVLKDLYTSYNLIGFSPDLYITIFYAIINLKDKTMIYSNAGLNVCPIIFNKEKFEILRVPGIPISNWLESPVYQNNSAKLAVGDRIYFYTDGVIEIRNNNNEQYGESRLLEILLNVPSKPVIVLNKIVDNACQFADIKDASESLDDITMALIEIK